MLSKLMSYGLVGLNGFAVEVEVDISGGLPTVDIVGLADTAIKESKERVRSAIKNSGRKATPRKVTVNLAPADVKKEGSYYDLAIALGILIADGQLKADLTDTVVLGELSLDGTLRHITGLLPMVISAYKDGYKKFIIPKSNENEACYIDGVEIIAAESLRAVIDHLSGLTVIEKSAFRPFEEETAVKSYQTDMALVKGQKIAKRALEVAVAGGHNILMVGPPGTGKTMLAKCIPTIMPEMTFEEALECTKIHSVAGHIKDNDGILLTRPFRSPHHTSTMIALTGGGLRIRPGEVSMAHNGVLFLDEMPEYSRQALESLRQPLEDGVVTVSRATGSIQFPANFMLVASMNPCPCGNYGSHEKPCSCTPAMIAKYKSKISGPLLDRIDIQVQVDNIKYSDIVSEENSESSETVKKRVNRARLIQRERFKDDNISTNSDMSEKHIKKYCKISEDCEKILHRSYEALGLSARARSRIIKVARTIADMALSKEIRPEHILEAVSYRQMDT